MRPRFWILLVALIAPSCGSAPIDQGGQPAAENPPLSIVDYAAMVERGEAFLVDVREKNEIMSGMAAPAMWMPHSMILSEDQAWREMIERFQEEPDKPVILYCQSGRRSGSTAKRLSNLSISTYNLGGLQSWIDAGLPTRRPQDPIPGR